MIALGGESGWTCSRWLKILRLVLFPIAFFYTGVATAQASASPSAGTMLSNFANDIPQLMRLVTAAAYVMGMWFIYMGVVGLKEFGEQRAAHSTHHDHLKGPLILIGVGTLLLYLPTSVTVGLTTFWTNPNPYGYITTATDAWDQTITDAYLIIQFIGTISFIRGLVILSHLSGQSAQPGTLGRGLTFIIAGVLCINLYDFINAVQVTLGTNTITITGSTGS